MSRRDWIIVCAKNRGTVACSFMMRLITALPPRGAPGPQFRVGVSFESCWFKSVMPIVLLLCLLTPVVRRRERATVRGLRSSGDERAWPLHEGASGKGADL